MTLVEAAVEALDSALSAERAGVDRIELCVNLSGGGTTRGAGDAIDRNEGRDALSPSGALIVPVPNAGAPAATNPTEVPKKAP